MVIGTADKCTAISKHAPSPSSLDREFPLPTTVSDSSLFSLETLVIYLDV